MQVFPVGFGPRVDIERESPFLPAEPIKLMESKQIYPVPVIIGTTRNEGGGMIRSKLDFPQFCFRNLSKYQFLKYLFLHSIGLLSNNGKLLKEFVGDPAKYFRFMIGMEDDAEHGSENTVNEILSRFLSIGKLSQPNQFNQLGDV